MLKKSSAVCIFFVFWTFAAFPVFAQSDMQQSSAIDVDFNESVMLARSSADYRVTPGDIYTLVYTAASSVVSYIIVVDTSHRIRVSNMGIINGAGKTFTQLKTEVENTVANNYPLSGVQLVLTQPAIFRVYINGEVHQAGEVQAWGLSRLSSLTAGNLTSYASTRNVSIRAANGQTQTYDLFRAQRLGDMSQDPFLRPGDVVTFNRINRVVTINGSVRRTGTYELLSNENLNELIELYGDGLSPLADMTRVEITRQINSDDIAGDKVFLTENDIAGNYALEHLDTVSIPAISQLRPVVFIEGAVISNQSDQEQSFTTSNRLAVQFNQGETYASLLHKNVLWSTTVSDTQNAYILRNNQRISINLDPILYDASHRDNILVEENDVLLIPFKQYFVTVAGAVLIPGRYPYIPNRDWPYYIAMAGGFVAGQNTKASISMNDINGKKMKKTDAILPETIITANTNHPLYYWNQYAPVLTTILSIATTFFSLQLYLSR